jgi:sulfonate transport system permease protein
MSQKAIIRPLEGKVSSSGLSRLPIPSPRSLVKFIVPVCLLLLWQYLSSAGVYSKVQLPEPVAVYKAAKQLWDRDKLIPGIEASLDRIARGFVIGSLIAIVLGLGVGLSKWIDELFSPTLAAIRAIPSLAWVPLLIIWMGIDERPKITLVAIGVFFPVFANLVSGIRQIDRKLIEAATAYGYKRLPLMGEVILPAALPNLFTGLRLGLAQGWLFLVAAEMIASTRGLGYWLIDAQNSSRTDIVLLAIILLAVLGKLTDTILQIVERRLLRWSDTFKPA